MLYSSFLSIPVDGHSRSGIVGSRCILGFWECFNLLNCNNQLSKITLHKTTKKELTSLVKVPPSVAPLLGGTCTTAATLNAPLDPKLSRPHPLHKKSESIIS